MFIIVIIAWIYVYSERLTPLADIWKRTCVNCGSGMNLHLQRVDPFCDCQKDSLIVANEPAFCQSIGLLSRNFAAKKINSSQNYFNNRSVRRKNITKIHKLLLRSNLTSFHSVGFVSKHVCHGYWIQSCNDK